MVVAILGKFLAHKGGRWDLLGGRSLTGYIQDRGPMCCRAMAAGVGVCPNPVQHTSGGPVVKGQLPGAVAAHPNPHGPQQHSHTGHGLLC